MRRTFAGLSGALIVLAVALSLVSSVAAKGDFDLASTIAFTSTRDDPANPQLGAEIYLIDPDGQNPRRLTFNHDGDAFPALSPDGKKLVFDSNRNRGPGEPLNTSDLFLMNADGAADGGEPPLLTRGSSATWSPDSKNIAFHASASGSGLPIKPDPGGATSDSDIFVVNVDDVLSDAEQPRNVTNSPAAIDDDPDWAPDGQRLAFTSHDASDDPGNSTSAEIYTLDPDGTGAPEPLTDNSEEERGPTWSPDGTRIAFACRRGGPDFEICTMNADGNDQAQLTNNAAPDLTPTWSPDGSEIAFHRPVAGRFQLFKMNANGTGVQQLTNTPGLNLFANWGELRVRGTP